MAQYQSIPKIVEALQWTGENVTEMKAFIANFREFIVMEDKTAFVREYNNDVDFILPFSYVIKKGETFASSHKEKFERDYELKEKDLFFENVPIVILKGVDIANEGASEFWCVQVPENYEDFVCGWLSTTKLIDVSEIVNLAFLEIRTFDESKTEYSSLSDANKVAEYMKIYLKRNYECEIVIFA